MVLNTWRKIAGLGYLPGKSPFSLLAIKKRWRELQLHNANNKHFMKTMIIVKWFFARQQILFAKSLIFTDLFGTKKYYLSSSLFVEDNLWSCWGKENPRRSTGCGGRGSAAKWRVSQIDAITILADFSQRWCLILYSVETVGCCRHRKYALNSLFESH